MVKIFLKSNDKSCRKRHEKWNFLRIFLHVYEELTMQGMKYFWNFNILNLLQSWWGKSWRGLEQGFTTSIFEICLMEALIMSLKCKERYSINECWLGNWWKLLTLYPVSVHVYVIFIPICYHFFHCLPCKFLFLKSPPPWLRQYKAANYPPFPSHKKSLA